MYSPTIKPLHVQKLYQLKLRRKIAITKLVSEALDEYLARFEKNNNPLIPTKGNNYGNTNRSI